MNPFLEAHNCPNLQHYTNYFDLNITYHPPQRFSVVKSKFKVVFNASATIDELSIYLSIDRNRDCIIDKPIYSSLKLSYEWTFVCEFNSSENYKKEANNPQMINIYFRSKKFFKLSFCGLKVMNFQDGCGTPGVPLDASYRPLDNGSIEYFPNLQKYRINDNRVITCLYEGNWNKEPPIFEPIVKCKTDKIELNSTVYKIVKFEKFYFFNNTKVAVIDSKILFQCYNEKNSSKIFVWTCDHKGLWTGDDFKCKL
jgi:hypothetical protein